ncbi:MAG TPA: hypothetical protein DCM08_06800 [Microscillaceae bacterium]|jgi:hypothetical protein|nr:hypothetical protein [Microscillaceae bacterium]
MKPLHLFKAAICLWVCILSNSLQAQEGLPGIVDNNTYKNAYLGFMIPLHPDWLVQDGEVRKQLIDLGVEMIGTDNAALEQALKSAQQNQRIFNLLTLSKMPLGVPGPSLIIMAEYLGEAASVMNDKNYLMASREMMHTSKLPVRCGGLMEKTLHNNTKLFYIECKYTTDSAAIEQQLFVHIFGKFAVSFVISYDNEEDKAILENLISSLQY